MAVKVGFGAASLWGTWRPELQLADSVEVTCFAVDDGRETPALVLVADVCGMWPSTCGRLRAAVARRVATAADRVGVFCTQNHGAPMEDARAYDQEGWEARFIDAAEQAVGSLQPCTMSVVEAAPSPSGMVRRRVHFADAGRFSFFFGFEVGFEVERLAYTAEGTHVSWCGIAPERVPGSGIDHPLFCLRVGDALIAGLPGEPFGRYSVELRRRVAPAAPTLHVLVAEECNGYLSYIPTADEYPLGGYGPASAILDPGWEAVLLDASVALARRCADLGPQARAVGTAGEHGLPADGPHLLSPRCGTFQG